jgi:hypothetical protein
MSRARLFAHAIGLAIPLGSVPSASVAQQPAAAARASIRGIAVDSLRGRALAGAYIALMPSGKQVETQSDGSYRFDDVAAGTPQHLVVMHGMLDTLGITLTSPEFTLKPAEIRSIDLAVPNAKSLIRAFCGDAVRARGPNALIGFVRDPDTGAPVDSVTISLVYDLSPIRNATLPVVRTARPDASGPYSVCGLPANLNGTVELSRAGATTGSIPVSADSSMPLAIRAFGISRTTRVASGADTGTDAVRVIRGAGTVSGRVVNKAGQPVVGAHVQMANTLAATVTGADGAFSLDSVPTGTQVLAIRKIGFAFTERTIEVALTSRAPITVSMSDAPALKPVVVSAERRVKDLESVGFTRRRERGFGFYLEGEQIDRGPEALGEALRMIPGLRVGYDAKNQQEQKTMIMSSRDNNSCITYVVDGMVWQSTAGGDIEKFIRPSEIEALEMYSSANVPPEFIVAGKSKCSVLVLWTKLKIHNATTRP